MLHHSSRPGKGSWFLTVWRGRQGRTRPSHEERAVTQAVARAARCRRLSQRPEQLAYQLRQAILCRPACQDCDHRGHGEFPRQSANEQVAANALVRIGSRSPAPGSLRGLEWDARFRLRPPVSGARRPGRAGRQGGMIPLLWTLLCASRPAEHGTAHPASARSLDPGDLRALDTKAGHQALLAEDEGVDILRERRRSELLRHTLVDHDHAGAHADLEAL
jgi:hypothetical protein